MSTLQAVIFDFDGVIADSERLHMRAFQDALQTTAVTLTDEAYYADYLGFDDHGVFRHLGQDQGHPFDAATIERLVADKGRRYEALAAAGHLVYPGAEAFIRAAAARVPIAVASGAQTHEIDDVLVRAGLRDLFTAVVGADQTAASKPAPDPYLEAFARIERAVGYALDASRTVAIEDSRWGLESARAAGLRTVAVTTSYPAEALAAHAELVVESLDGLPLEALDRLCVPA
ncbi:MAG: HAD family phosphatase [Vicinamibacterales bacterium]